MVEKILMECFSDEEFQARTVIKRLGEYVGKSVILMGWIHRKRLHGQVIFLDLRDESGFMQLVIPKSLEIAKFAETLKEEYVIFVKGEVAQRSTENINPKVALGHLEVFVSDIKIINKSEPLPFAVNIIEGNLDENLRMRYRYLDLRRENMRQNMLIRHKVIKFIRDYMDSNDFLEVETPMLTKGTPEGSREYVVPSRVSRGQFYVLPQSPQQFKQLLMVGGIGRYFQIARCFRDEDLRADRQPEFTQLDIEMSFICQEQLLSFIENFLIALFQKFNPEKNFKFMPFKRMSYEEAMSRYGSDKPDLRFDMPILDATQVFQQTSFQVFSNILKENGKIKGIKVDNKAFTVKEIKELTQMSIDQGGTKGMFAIHFLENSIKSSLASHLKPEEVEQVKTIFDAKPGDTILLIADIARIVHKTLGILRLEVAKRLGIMEKVKNDLAFLWVIDFPLMDWSEEENKYVTTHHPFTSPKDEDIDSLFTGDPLKILTKAYDIVLNGSEMGGGSIRIHNQDLQHKIFEMLSLKEEDIQARFGHMLRAFQYGAPPHGGIAFGVDRLVTVLQNGSSIRDVIAFPKNNSARDLLMEAPSPIHEDQLKELGIQIEKPKTE